MHCSVNSTIQLPLIGPGQQEPKAITLSCGAGRRAAAGSHYTKVKRRVPAFVSPPGKSQEVVSCSACPSHSLALVCLHATRV